MVYEKKNGRNGAHIDTHKPGGEWIVRPAPKTDPRLRLWSFHYAGGSASLYQEWPTALPDDIEVCAVQLPGRGHRFVERPINRMGCLVTALADALSPELRHPFALFGYSMGALVAFELAREMRRRHLPGPCHLFVAARRAPQLPSPHNHNLSGLPDDQLLTFLADSGNVKMSDIAGGGAFMRMMLPTLRADCQVAENYLYEAEPPLDCPISAYGGDEDPYVLETHLRAWGEHTRCAFDVQIFQGNHFFLHNSLPSLPQEIGLHLQAANIAAERETL